MGHKRGKQQKAKAKAKASRSNTPRRPPPPPQKHTRGSRFRADEVAPSFSLQDEARWASSHRSNAFSADKKLRFMRIEFVSAGQLEGTIKQKEHPEPERPPSTQSASDSPTAATAMAKMALSSPSPPPSDAGSSSEDEVVFRGRSGIDTHVGPSTETPSNAEDNAPSAAPEQARPDALRAVVGSTSSKASPDLVISSSVTAVTAVSVSETTDISKQPAGADIESGSGDSVIADGFEKRLDGQSKWMTGTTSWESRSKPGIGWLPVKERTDMDALLDGKITAKEAAEDDYLQNIRDEILGQDRDSFRNTFAQRPLDLDDDDSDAYRADLGDGEDDEEDEAEISRVIDAEESLLFDALARQASSGDFDFSDRSDIFIADDAEDDDEEEDDNDDNDDDDDEDDDSEAENEINQDMDDERLARVLQQQEELGLGSDEILLYGGDDFFDGSLDEQIIDRPHKKRRQRHLGGRGGRREPTFPSATALADALDMDPYGGFDVMDTERPSLRPVKKGRRGPKPAELSDSDLNEQLQSTWERDRAKKRLKKAEREELRKQGLLGRKGKAPDLSVRYKGGFDMNDLVEEIREFMFSDMQTLSLPPMEAHRRAVVHQMVHQLGVNSKSRGNGKDRFTVLSKTMRTKTVEHSFFDALVHKKSFQARFSTVSTRAGPNKKSAHKGYRDGEVVGARAAELGPENKGRVLLEKMGWSKGMALGALDNKGILQPIAATLKTGKAGLG